MMILFGTKVSGTKRALGCWVTVLCWIGLSLGVFPAYGQTATALEARLTRGSYPEEVRTFYQQRAYAPAWIAEGRPDRQVPSAITLIAAAERHGLDAEAYHLSRVEALFKAASEGALSNSEAVLLDLLLTEAMMRYGRGLLQGRINPRSVHAGWSLPLREKDLVSLLEGGLREGRVAALWSGLSPTNPAYARLQQALVHYRGLAARGGWPLLPDGPALRLEDEGARVTVLREQLRILGDLPAHDTTGSDVFDARLDEAVQAFQQRHGLDVDGIVGRETQAALNVPVAARIRQIERTLERLRWLPDDLGPRYLLINIAGYNLWVIEEGRPVLTMRVIVGTPRTPTPVFSTRLTEVVLAPYWNVPASIARNEILPRVRRDPGYLARNHMRLLPGGRIRQDPGPANALGRLKFIITNPYGVGLHDTPDRHLFQESTCAFSHGCMRAQHPLDLAAYVLRDDTTWTREKMEATIERWKETRIPVADPLPVHVLYWTAWVDEEGPVQFRPDVYGHDARLEQLLQEAQAVTLR